MRIVILVVSLLAVTSMNCRLVRPAVHALPPGISASFPPNRLTTNRQYQEVFCSVLAERPFSAGNWQACNNYVLMPTAHQPQSLPKLSDEWTLLLVGGFGAQCFSPKVEAFKDAAEHLKQFHGLSYYTIEVAAFGSSEDNAKIIKDKVDGLLEKRFIAVVHSKGAADFMVALTTYPDALKRVEALVTVAGAVGGSWLIDDLVRLNETVLRRIALPSCLSRNRNPQNGLDSMRRDNRQNYLASVPHAWRAYSISAVAAEKKTSKVLQPLWRRLSPYAVEQDSHIVEREALVPGGEFLGRALGDHWAVAMPFDPNPNVSSAALRVIDQNRFPREALIEAAIRVVTTPRN